MTETFRTSPFIDFNQGIVHASPDTLFTAMPEPWSLDDKIKLFECRVEGPAARRRRCHPEAD